MPAMREYTIYVRLPAQPDPDSETADEANVIRICEAFEAAGFDGDDWEFGDTQDINPVQED